MTSARWPFFGLRILTPRLELRYPDDADCELVAELSTEQVHDPGFMPFTTPWTRAPLAERPRGALQHLWRQRSELQPDHWRLLFLVTADGEPVGIQAVGADDFQVTRAVSTGSWIVQRAQGQGIGKEMRAAVLHLAFEGLGAAEAHTSAFADNGPSVGVTTSLGYRPNGIYTDAREGVAARHLRFLLTRADWQRRADITIEGLDPCRRLLGAATPDS